MAEDLMEAQKNLCQKFGVGLVEASAEATVGVAANVKPGAAPINGLRRKPQGDATGWFLWAGEEEISSDPSSFTSVTVAKLGELCPAALKFMGMPPGWRFVVTKEYEDVWQDNSLV